MEQLSMLLATEEAMILGQQLTVDGQWFNRGEVDLDNTSPINTRFETIAEAHPTSTAIIHGKDNWTYTQVNELANQIAHTLRQNGIQKGDFVGVYMERNPLLVCALLGIIKSGAAYIPLDTQNPTERIEKMMLNSDMAGVISLENQLKNLQNLSTERLFLLDEKGSDWTPTGTPTEWLIVDRKQIDQASTSNPTNENEMDSWAYLLYTSGSTGEPKGAITRHDG
ncbi:MAG: AMP-binding protein, partial [Bacteroidota bacterium]